MTIKQQYESLDLAKLPKNVLAEIEEIKADSQNFTQVLDFIQEDWDLLWNEVIQKKYKEAIKSKAKKTQTTKPKKEKPTRSKKQTTSKKIKETVDVEKVAHYSEEYRLIKRFYNVIGKEVSFRKAQLLFWAFEKAIVSRKVRKASSDAKLFNTVNKKVVELFNLMKANEVKIIKKVEIRDSKLMKELETFVKGHRVDEAVRLLNRFIGLQGKKIKEEQAERLHKAIEKAIETKKVASSHRLYSELLKAGVELSTFREVGKPIPPQTQTLSGVKKKEVTKPISTMPTLNGSPFVMASDRDKQKAPNTFRLGGEIGKFLQDLQRYRLAIALTGDPHAGKSEFVKQIVDAFLSKGFTCGFFDLEQGGMSSKDTRSSIDRNISKENQKRLAVAGEAPQGIDTVKEFANQFDVVVIDSWQKLNIPNPRFDELRLEYPNTIFIIIFQQNGKGGTRGGVTVDYDTPISIKVHRVDETFENNYAELIKNRGNQIGLKYLVFSKNIIS